MKGFGLQAAGIVVVLLALTGCGQKRQAGAGEVAKENLDLRPGDLFELGKKPPPAGQAPAYTIDIDIIDPNPMNTVAKITSSDGSSVEPINDLELNSAISMDLSRLGDGKNKEFVRVNLKLDPASNTILHPGWPLTTNKDGKNRLHLIEGSAGPKAVSFWIDRKAAGKKVLDYNIHYRTTYPAANRTEIVNDWAFDPKVRNEG